MFIEPVASVDVGGAEVNNRIKESLGSAQGEGTLVMINDNDGNSKCHLGTFNGLQTPGMF